MFTILYVERKKVQQARTISTAIGSCLYNEYCIIYMPTYDVNALLNRIAALKMDNSFNGRTNPKLFFIRQPQNKHFRISSLRHSWKIFLEEKEKIHLM